MTTEAVSSIDTSTEQTERMLSLSDALFAIAITFLALDIGDVAGLVPGDVGQFLYERLADYLVYFGTFVLVGYLWWRHHLIFRYIKGRNAGLSWLNILLLALVAALPYPAALVREARGMGLALAMLLVPLTAIGLLLWAEWEVAFHFRLVIPDLPVETTRYIRATVVSTPLVLAVASVVALVSWQRDSSQLCLAAAVVGLLLLVAPSVLRLRWPTPEQAVEYLPDSVADAEVSADVALADSNQRARSMLTRIHNGSDADRLKVLTDGVVAIAVTILALQLRPPPIGTDITNSALLSNLASAPWYPYFLTFGIAGVFWLGHVRIFERVQGVDTVLIWLNLIFLMFIAFLPLPTELLAVASKGDAVLIEVLYLSVMFIVSVVSFTMSTYAMWAKHIARPRSTRKADLMSITSSAIGCLAFLVAIVLVSATGNPAFYGSFALVFLLRSSIIKAIYGERLTER
ncbi:MAG: TMEM175 family protein [Actinomycetes bacterium]